MNLKPSLFLLLLTGLALLLAACGGTPTPNDTFALNVSVSGPGTVTSSAGDISCPGTCSDDYAEGATVRLTATPTGGAAFAGWSGDCSGTGACTVTMNSAKSVTATFTGGPDEGPTLSVTVTGNGTVTGGGINCPGTCSVSVDEGAEISLTATPTGSATFSGWGGACSGTGGCTVTMDGDKTVTAAFAGGGGGTEFPAGTVFLTSSDLELNYDSGFGVHQLVGIRFVPELPAGATINSARIAFSPKGGDASPLTISIAAQATADAPTFTTAANDISSRSLTSAVDWVVPVWNSGSTPEDLATPDLSGLMTEAGWSSGNGIVFVLSGDGSNNQRNTNSFDEAAAKAPKLVITYNGTQTYEVAVAQSSDDAEENLEAFSNLTGRPLD